MNDASVRVSVGVSMDDVSTSIARELPLASPAGLPSSLFTDGDSAMTFAVCTYASDGSAPTTTFQTRAALLATVQALPDAGLTAADIRSVDPRLNRLEPARGLTKPGATLVSLGPWSLGALILQDRFYVMGLSADSVVMKTSKAAFLRLRPPVRPMT